MKICQKVDICVCLLTEDVNPNRNHQFIFHGIEDVHTQNFLGVSNVTKSPYYCVSYCNGG